MGLGVVELLVLFVVLPLVGFAVAAYLLGTARRAAVMDEQLTRARRHQVGISMLAGAAALATLPLASALSHWQGQSAVLPLLPSLMVAAACAVLWIGELTFPRPTGLVRSTVLNARGLDSVVPRGWLRLCLAMAVLDIVVFAAGALTAHGGDGLRFEGDWGSAQATPYPGTAYVLPQLLALASATLIAWGVCRAAANRATIASDLEGDAVLRRASGGRVLRWLAWGMLATAAIDLTTGGSAWLDIALDDVAWVGAVALWLGRVLIVAAIALPFVPVARLAREPRAMPAGAR
jgi:hypothetical protein